jgi:hypothetical protein
VLLLACFSAIFSVRSRLSHVFGDLVVAGGLECGVAKEHDDFFSFIARGTLIARPAQGRACSSNFAKIGTR